ncbi:MAG: hypothetical protein ACRDRL_09235 [Sciscionella sp.]
MPLPEFTPQSTAGAGRPETPAPAVPQWQPACQQWVRHLVAPGTSDANCCVGQLTRHATARCGQQAFTGWPSGASWDDWPHCPDCERGTQ